MHKVPMTPVMLYIPLPHGARLKQFARRSGRSMNALLLEALNPFFAALPVLDDPPTAQEACSNPDDGHVTI